MMIWRKVGHGQRSLALKEHNVCSHEIKHPLLFPKAVNVSDWISQATASAWIIKLQSLSCVGCVPDSILPVVHRCAANETRLVDKPRISYWGTRFIFMLEAQVDVEMCHLYAMINVLSTHLFQLCLSVEA